ncbi:Lrp/AsnC family transcriptional regulator [Chishuiella changwenlii]|jgi:DNA-binding Lrp family transcriptional regulator|uniref:Lrp/AsnC family transcriptional regulator n=1 Tax=Chishuiella changwenlii TaxID=1434701 RepID=UPI002FD9FF4B
MLDILDYKILDILQKDNLTSQRDIGEAIGLSAPAVQRRIKKLREDGIIEKDVSVINRDKLGNKVTILVELFLECEKIEQIDALKEQFSIVPEIQQYFYVTGESDFFLVIVVPTMKDYEILSRELFFSNKNIKRFRTVVAMSVDKNSLEIPLNFNFLNQ